MLQYHQDMQDAARKRDQSPLADRQLFTATKTLGSHRSSLFERKEHSVRQIDSNPKELEDPCGDLEITPPSRLFSYTSYGSKKPFSRNQRLASDRPSFSAQASPACPEHSSLIPDEFPIPGGEAEEISSSREKPNSGEFKQERMTGPMQLTSDTKIEHRRTYSLPTALQQAQADLPAPKDLLMRCYIRRNRGSLSILPTYYMHTSEGHHLLLAAKKCPHTKTSRYLITQNETEFSVNSTGYLGQLRSNFLGTVFNLYGKGTNPCKSTAPATFREDMALIKYSTRVLGQKGHRKMIVVVPTLDAEGRRKEWRPASVYPKQRAQTIASQFEQGNFEDMLTYFSKPPVWDEGRAYADAQAFVHHFSGHMDKNSAKNFQLIDNQDEAHIYLQFGRAEKDLFALEFQWPLSPMQAFGLALSSLDKKIVFE